MWQQTCVFNRRHCTRQQSSIVGGPGRAAGWPQAYSTKKMYASFVNKLGGVSEASLPRMHNVLSSRHSCKYSYGWTVCKKAANLDP